ncbi:MAG: SurA N-terminal domain-containing protein [Verrucomicrobiota bacterium]
MFGTIRRHQKWLWIVISGVTIISFLAFFSPRQARGQRRWLGHSDQVGTINGRALHREEYAEAYREAELRYVFSYGDWPGNDSGRLGSMIDRETRQRLLLIEKLKDLNIEVTETAVAGWIREQFQGENKAFRKDAYDQFIRNLPNRGLSQQDFERFARHEVGIQHLVALAGAAGKLVTPQEAEVMIRQQQEEIEASAVFIASSNYLAQVTVDPAAVTGFYNTNLANYRIPEKFQVRFVKFANSNYLADADQELAKNTNLNQYVEGTYKQRGTNAFTGPDGLPLSADAAKAKIREEVREAGAQEEARRRAVDFVNELGRQEKAVSLENFAAAKGLVAEVSEPFTQYQTPPNMKVPASFGQTVAKLTPEDPFVEQPVQGEDGIYVVSLERRIPSEVPQLEAIQERVNKDYLNSRALDLARAAGRQLHTAITNGMTQGKTFEALVAENNASPVLLAPFSRKATTLPGIANSTDVPTLVRTAFTTGPGKVTDFVPTRSGGFLVYVRSIVPVTDAKVQAELPDFLKNLRQSRQYEAFSEWFQKEMESARLTLAGDKQRASAK